MATWFSHLSVALPAVSIWKILSINCIENMDNLKVKCLILNVKFNMTSLYTLWFLVFKHCLVLVVQHGNL